MFAIDIGTTCLKALRLGEIAASPGRLVVEASELCPTERGWLAGNFAALELGDRKALVAALERSFRAVGAQGAQVAVSLPDQFVKVFFLQVDRLQDVTPAERKYTEWRLRQLLPGNVAEGCVLDYQVLSTNRGDEGVEIRLVVQLVREDLLNDLATLVLDGGCKPGFFNCDSISSLNLAEASIRQGEEEREGSDACLLHLGHEATSFIFTRLGVPEWIRILDYGCRKFEDRLVDRFGLDRELARRHLAEEALIPGTAPQESELVEALGRFHGVFDEWFREVGSTFAYFRSHYPSIGPLPVRLCGGGTILRNLPSFLESLLDLPVSLLDVGAMVEMPQGLDGHDAMRLVPAAGIALTALECDREGLALAEAPPEEAGEAEAGDDA